MRDNKKLSPIRVMLAVAIVVGASLWSSLNWSSIKDTIVPSEYYPWFASYVDVTSTPRYSFEQDKYPTEKQNLVLAFIVSDKEDACTPSWGAAYTMDEARGFLDLDRRIARFVQKEGNIAISFGGLLNDELAVNCKDNEKLLKAYESVLDRYQIDTIDFDIEGDALSDTNSIIRRAEVVAQLQAKRWAEDKNLAVWLTLPVAPSGLTTDGTDAVAQMLKAGVDLSGVNVMTMDYGQSKETSQSMSEASQRALVETHRQLGILYKQAGISLSDVSLWSKIGATPMIGQNDVAGEIFSLEDAEEFNRFATSKKIGRMSMWSANRDIKCGENYVNTTIVSDSCSGVDQEKFAFAAVLANHFNGKITANAAIVTQETGLQETKVDNPEESPYQIWSEQGTYLEGTKVVWHGNVYLAKWWTQGDLPDNPVLDSYQTPWQLVGPVLPGEKPIPQPTLKPGTYPNWDGTTIYDVGQRVLFGGTPYQAKWWTQGDSPAASTSNPDSSPWKALTREQIEEVLQ